MFEGCIRVPCIVKYPPAIPASSTSDAFCSSLGLVPTLTKLCGVSTPESLVLDGYDLLPTLAGKAPSPRKSMFWQRQDDRAARVGNWKWVDSERGRGLFDLSRDIGEEHDLSQSHPEKFGELRRAFADWLAEMDLAEPRGPFHDF